MQPAFVPAAATLYPLRVEKIPPQRGPTLGLYLGLIVTIVAVLAYAGYITRQFAGLRKLQSEMVDRNRKDSLQLLRIQNDLNSLGLAMRDMLDASEPYPLIAWTAQFDRTRNDLSAALKQEESLAEATRTSDQRLYLTQSLTQFWDACDRMFSQAQNGQEKAAREQIRDTLQPQQAALSSAVSRLLVQNNEGEEQAAARIAEIYDRVQRQLYYFLAAILLAIVVTSLYLIRNNRRIFAHVAELSLQRSELAQQLIATQESTLRHISRELHGEFGPARRFAGSARDCPVHAQQYPQLVAGVAPCFAGRGRAGKHARLVCPHGGTPDWTRAALRKIGPSVSFGSERERATVPRGAGSAQQCGAAFRRERSLGAFALSARQ